MRLISFSAGWSIVRVQYIYLVVLVSPMVICIVVLRCILFLLIVQIERLPRSVSGDVHGVNQLSASVIVLIFHDRCEGDRSPH